MNKETIDYTSEEFWKNAPEGATHWEPGDDTWNAGWIKVTDNSNFFWSNHQKDWRVDFRMNESYWQHLVKTFIPRPTTFTKVKQENTVTNNWFVNGKCVALPPVGTMVQNDLDYRGYSEVIHHRGDLVVVEQEEGVFCHLQPSYILMPKSRLKPYKKEPTIQEKILEAWKAQGIDFAYDNEDTNFSFKVLVDFVVNNFDVKEKY